MSKPCICVYNFEGAMPCMFVGKYMLMYNGVPCVWCQIVCVCLNMLEQYHIVCGCTSHKKVHTCVYICTTHSHNYECYVFFFVNEKFK